ncbi:MAG: photosynthetic complex assembly protein PuhC, partial [Pseudomonadota bacterium]
VPRWMIRAVLALILSILALVTLARLTDHPLMAVPEDTPVVAERLVTLTAANNGATTVTAPDGTLIEEIASRDAGFISGMARVIERERMKHNIDPATPIAIQLREKGRISLYDPATGWSAELASYGASNTRAFAKLLGVTPTAEGSQ